MGAEATQYSLSCESSRAVFKGQFSLTSPAAFDELYGKVRSGIENAADAYTLDLTDALFMSSSGITALARVIMFAQGKDTPLIIRVNDAVLWQRKTVVALQNLWEKLTVEKA